MTVNLDPQPEEERPGWAQPGGKLWLIEQGSWANKGTWVSPVVIDRVLKRDIVGHRLDVPADDRRRELRWRVDSYRPPAKPGDDPRPSWAREEFGCFERMGGPTLLPEGHPKLDGYRWDATETRLRRRYDTAIHALEKHERALTHQREGTIVGHIREIALTATALADHLDTERPRS